MSSGDCYTLARNIDKNFFPRVHHLARVPGLIVGKYPFDLIHWIHKENVWIYLRKPLNCSTIYMNNAVTIYQDSILLVFS